MNEQQPAKKTLYHGEFRDMGAVQVHVKSDVLPSKKQKGQHYVILTIGGVDRYLHPENDQCLEFFRGLKGRDLTVQAAGHKEEATITLIEGGTQGDEEPEDEPPAPAKAPPPKPPVQQQNSAKAPAPAPAQTEDTLHDAKVLVARNNSFVKIALKAFAQLNVEFNSEFGTEIPDALAAAVFNGLCFGGSSSGVVRGLPLDLDLHTLAKRVHSKTGGAK